MKSVKVGNSIIEVPSTSREWELFDDEKAAHELSEAVIGCIPLIVARCNETYISTIWLRKLLREKVLPVMRRFSDSGALDSEPVYHLADTIRKIVNAADKEEYFYFDRFMF